MTVPDASPARPPRHRLFRLPKLRQASPEDWRQLLRFCFVGASGVVVNLAVFTLLVTQLDTHHLLAAVAAFSVAWTTNFLLNKHWTFQRHGLSVVQQGARNLLVSLVGLALNLIVLDLLVRLDVYEVAAQLAAIAVVTPLSFLLNRRWSFR